MYDRSKVFWWSPRPPLGLEFLRKENAGDVLGPHLVDRILKREGLDIGRIRRGRLFSIGSVMHFASNGAVIWGSGVNGKVERSQHRFEALDVRAVRGPLTAGALDEMKVPAPPVYGDPGLLTSMFWPGRSVTRTETLYVPHMRETLRRPLRRRFRVASPLLPLDRFIDEIQSAERVVTTSLHGVIIAESYGVPAQLVRNQTGETLFKYEDYYRGTGRDRFTVYESAEEALEDAPPPPFDPTPIQRGLLESFPFDLWR